MNREFPVSIYQKRFWDEWRRAPLSVGYNIPSVFEIVGTFDVDAMRRAMKDFIQHRQEVCRTFFVERGEELRQILLGDPEVDFDYEDATTSGGEPAKEGAREAFVRRYSHHVYDLRAAPLYKAGVIRHARDRYTFVISLHHAISDGISYEDYTRALSELYNKHRANDLSPVARAERGFEDYVAEELRSYTDEQRQADLAYWAELLREAPLSVELPQKRGARLDRPEGRFVYFALDRATSDGVRARAKGMGTTLFRLVSVLYASVLARFSNQEWLTLSHTVNLRPKPFRHLIGCFMNNVPLVFHVKPESTFAEIVAATDAQRKASRPHQNCPLSDIVERVRQVRGRSDAEVLNVGLNESPGWLRKVPLTLDGATCIGVPPEECESIYDLSIAYQNLPEIEFRIDYKVELLDEALVEAMQEHFRAACAAVLRDPNATAGSVAATSGAVAELVRDFPSDRTVDALVAEQVARSPHAVAASSSGRSLDYAELWQRAGVVAAEIQSAVEKCGEPAVGPGDRIAICTERHLDALVAILGILRTGAAYVPLDPRHPEDRLRYILDDSGARLVVTDDAAKGRELGGGRFLVPSFGPAGPAPAAAPVPVPMRGRSSQDVMYVLYTSGSTGRPKGVEVTHRNVVNFLCSVALEPGIREDDVLLAVTTVCFDISVLELFLPLIRGAEVALATADDVRDGTRLAAELSRSRATIMQATPATWQLLLAAEWPGSKGLKALCGGEALSPELAAALLGRTSELWNMYGPTETTIWSTVARVTDAGRVRLGRPVANTRLYVLDRAGLPVPPQAAGELVIAGEGVARGYHERPELTREKFVNELGCNDGTRLAFRTGDLVRVDAAGEIEFLGRIDSQVKIRGYRVELGEVESELLRLEEVHAAAVVARKSGQTTSLCAFVVPCGAMNDDEARALKARLRERLPDYMVPGTVVVLQALPLTANGKMDRKSMTELPIDELRARFAIAPQVSTVQRPRTVTAAERVRGRDGLLAELRTVVASLLARPASEIDVHQHLGELGFESIRFTALATQLSKRLETEIPSSLFYSFSTLQTLVDHLVDVHPHLVARGHRVQDAVPSAPAAAPAAILHRAPRNEGQGTPIAVVGMAGRFPGARDVDAFWSHLEEGRDLVTEIPPERWDWRRFYGDPRTGAGTLSRWGGFLDDVGSFDASFFGISPREAASMDPQQRLLLEVAWSALEEAGYGARTIAGSNTGVFVGAVGHDYWELDADTPIDGFTVSGFAKSILANRLSYLLDLRGPSATIDTACSSSLIAVARAVAAIRSGACDQALAGGVNVILNPYVHLALSRNGMLSPTGRCRAFDGRADGYVRSEGVGLVLLKPLDRALSDGDHVHGVILAAEENHGGRANNLATPNGRAQAALIARAYRASGVDPRSVSYIEAHGTGTALGDPIEFRALEGAFRELGVSSRVEAPWCGLGSVKSNVGHLESAAGIAGLVKVLLSMRHRTLPDLVHFESINPQIQLEGSPFFVAARKAPWTSPDGVLRAGLSSFGFGGSNAHLIVAEGPVTPARGHTAKPAYLVGVSAKTRDALGRKLDDLAGYIDRANPSLDALAHTLNEGRDHDACRAAFVVASTGELLDSVNRVRRGESIPQAMVSSSAGTTDPSAARGLARVQRSLQGDLDAARTSPSDYADTLAALAALYVGGHELDWAGLHAGEARQRLSVPTYPFAREIHWRSRATKEHPFLGALDAAKAARGEGAVYRRSLRSSEGWLADHQVLGRPVFAGVACLEMAMAGAKQLGVSAPLELRDVTWRRPVEVAEETEVELALRKGTSSGGYDYEVRAAGAVCATGTVLAEGAEGATSGDVVDVQAIQRRARAEWSHDDVYARFRAMGIDYGPRFQGLARLFIGADEVLGEVQARGLAGPGEGVTFHPTVADAALQAFIGLSPEGAPLLPFSIGRVVLAGALPDRGWVHGRRRDGVFDVTIADENGRIVASLRDVIHRPAPGFDTGFLYAPRWTPAPARPANVSEVPRTVILHRAGSAQMASALARACPGSGVETVELPGTGALAIDSALVQLGAIDRVLFLPDLPNAQADALDPTAVEQAEAEGALALLHVVKALQRYHAARGIALRVVVSDVHAPFEGAASPLGGAVVGLARAIVKELPGWSVSCVDVPRSVFGDSQDQQDQQDQQEQQRILARVFDVEGAPSLEIFRGGQWQVQTIERLQLPRPKSSPVRDRGVYLIVGGAGGIGGAFARHLAEHAGARCVLVGRRTSPPGLDELLERIRAAGGDAMYIAADASDSAAMQRVVAETKARFGALHGVVHSALVLADRSLARMDADTLRKPLASKLRGTAALLSAVRHEQLDFALFFSSAQSLLFNPGQSNYAAACASQDALAHAWAEADSARRVRIIHWGFWGKIGAVATEAYRQRMSALGVGSIEESEGMDVIERVLAGDVPEVLAIKLRPDAFPSLGSPGVTASDETTHFDAVADVTAQLEELV